MLQVHNACKQFGSTDVLKNVSFSIDKNIIMGLAGSSGSGKTTLLRCLQQLESLDSGIIVCNGSTGFMFQDFQLFPHMTVQQNLTYAPRLMDTSKDYDVQAMTILTNLGIGDKADVYPHKLSGGQKQRVALARSLMMHPQLLLCDEPTSGLDVATTLDVVTLLESVRAMGVTMIIASHDLDFLTKVSDRILVLKEGEIGLDINPKTMSEDPIQFLKQFY